MRATVDRITLEVVCEALVAVVREMRASIIRASYSSAIYELDDFSCALFDPQAQMVAQSEDHPGHVMPMPWSVKCAMEDFAGDIKPGDLILLNDAYRGGTHLNDVTLLYPVHDAGELTIFPSVRAHWADVGGMTPGSYSGLATSIFQEGLRIPPIKLYEDGRPNRAAHKLIEANMRLPDERTGDLEAMVGACRVAERRIRELFAKYGRDVVLVCIRENLDRSERRMRERIRALPDGVYVAEDYLEYYDEGRFDPVLMRLALTKRGDSIVADFAGSNPQVPGVVNSSLAVAGAGVFVALKSTLDPGGAVNSGVFRPIALKAPEASIVDVRPDAPAGAHGEVRKRAVSVMLGCLAQMVPDLVSGDLCGTSFPNSIGGRNRARDRSYVYVEVPAGGNGGFAEADGSSAYVNVDFGNIRSIHNAESIENEMPLLVERSALRTDTGGPGRRRGGLGMRRQVRLLDGEAVYSVLGDRAVIPPFGVGGAGSAGHLSVSIERGNSEHRFKTPGKVTGHRIRADDSVVMESAGGGGYGDPLEREPDLVRRDVIAGLVSLAQSRTAYGVVIGAGDAVDGAATARLRQELKAARVHLPVVVDERDPYEGIKGRHRTLRLSPASAQRIGAAEGDLIELLGRHPVPLRAWVKLDPAQQSSAPLDAFARQALGVDAGDSVELRRLDMPAAVRMPAQAAE
ncbi:MAG: hydantoinase B/oxoprolinase family protein [Alphaproteobacteria bacterium]|nr:hydantoinase B/oxoprolinase family protein [Alphaproteobacteria bacterium]